MTTARSAALSCLLAATAVGGSIAVTPFIADFPVLAGQAGRYALAAVALAVALPSLDATTPPRLTRGDLGRLLLAAATGSAGFNVLLVAASRHAEPAAIGAVVGASPVVLAVLGAPRVGGRLPRPRPAVVIGALLASGGVVALHGGGRSTVAGLLLAIGVLACEVCFTLVAAPLLPRLGPARVSTWSCALAAAILATASLVTRERLRQPTTGEAGTLLYQGLVMTAVAFVLWYRGVHRLGPDRAGVTMAAAPVAAAGVAAVVGTGDLTVAGGVGAGLVAVGVVAALCVSPPSRRPSSSWSGAAAPVPARRTP